MRPAMRTNARTWGCSSRCLAGASLRWCGELVLDSVANRLGARPDSNLDEDVVHVLVRGARRNAYRPRDRPVGEPPGDQLQDLGLTRAEKIRPSRPPA